MLRGLSLTDLARKIEGNRALKRDYIANTSTVTMTVQDDNTPVLELPNQGQFPILPIAHDQIGTKLNIPAKYYDRMLAEAPNLLANNVNEWFRHSPEPRMFRTLGGDTRAFLSDRYNRIENEQIAEVALPVLADLPGINIVSCEVTDRRLYIHFAVSTIEGEVKKGDIVQAGGIISNSEVGLGAVSVTGFLWRLICLNGMKTGEAFRKNHIGRKMEDNEALWADDTRKADDTAILLKVRDMVKAVVDETRFRAMIERLQGFTTAKISGDPVRAVEVLAQKVNASEFERGGILRSLIEGNDLSAWGMMNAITAQAHTANSYDRAVELEGMGGSLISLPTTEWREILQAA